MPRPLVIALLTAASAGCGGALATSAPEDPPERVVAAYADALSRGDAEAVTALEADAAHRGRDAAAQGALVDDAREELAELGRGITEAPPSALRVHARAPVAGGEMVVMTRDPDGGWRIEGGVLGVPALVAPRDAVAALRSALVRRDLRGVEEVLAQRTRAAWEDELGRVIEQTSDPDALQIRVDGERAIVTTPDGVVIELMREAEEWRVLDVRPTPAAE